MEKSVYFVVMDGPAAIVWIDERDPDDCWQANINERGWTRQDVERRHGSIYGEFDNRREAEELREELLAQFD